MHYHRPGLALGPEILCAHEICHLRRVADNFRTDPTRTHKPENDEQKVHGLYANIYVADKYEGLIAVGIATTIDGNPTNNFLKREVTFNPDGVLTGARHIALYGVYAYISCDAGLVVVSLDDPKHPEVKAVLGPEETKHPHAVQFQFRYAYVCDEEGLKVLDVTDPAKPVVVKSLEMEDVHNIYLADLRVCGGR